MEKAKAYFYNRTVKARYYEEELQQNANLPIAALQNMDCNH